MTYSEIKAEINAASKTYLPGLLVAVVKASLDKKVFKPGGAARIAQAVEDEITGQPEDVASGSTQATGSAVLCYVDGQWAYFTTRNISEQWGDDWNDAPHEHNAGTPYEYHDHDKKEGREPWQIIKVAWDGDFEQPSEGRCNSPWSVEQINAGAVAWLHTSKWRTGKPVVIPAGTTLERFCELICEGGGTVYLANDAPSCGKRLKKL